MQKVLKKMTRRELLKHGGRALTALTLPSPFTSFTKFSSMKDSKIFDVIIIGGSYAGLSAAMALGRSLRNVLIIDSGLPCNRQTPHSHNFITHDGAKPSTISKKAKEQVLKYETVQYLKDVAMSGTKAETGFNITTQSGDTFQAKKLIFATGIKDTMPDIKGFAACWGISVIHCPYCHGYEFKKKATGIFADGMRGFHLASLVNNLTDNLTILTNSRADFNETQLEKLNKNGITIIETPITEIEHEAGHLKNVVFSDGTKKSFDALYVALPFSQHSDIPAALGCEFTEQGHIKVSPFQETNIHGVFACGDNSHMMRSVATAVYTGNITGAVVNGKLVEEKF